MSDSTDIAQDPTARLAKEVLLHLCRSTLLHRNDGPQVQQQLARLPEIAAYFVTGAVTDEDRRRVDPLVHRLRATVQSVIDQRVDRSASRRLLADRVAAARETFILRPWRSEDAPRLAALLDNERLWSELPDDYPGPFTDALAHHLIEISNGWAERHVVEAVVWRGEPIGQVRLQADSSPYPDEAEISYWVGEPYWGKGLATGFVTLFTAESFRRRPSLKRVFAVVLDGNIASMRVLEKAGYRYESFRFQNVSKRNGARSTHLFGVGRNDYE
jgi:RimJ/RimL family protein N-acetyltransferase